MKRIQIINCFIIVLGIVFFISCEDEKEIKLLSNKIEIVDLMVTSINYKNATVASRIPNSFGVEIDEFGHCWGLDTMPDIEDSLTIFTDYSESEFISNIKHLNHNTKYYVRTYIKFDDNVKYDSVISFKTIEIKVPSVQINGYSSLKVNSVNFGGQVSDFDVITTDSVGFCWSTKNNPTIDDESIVGYISDYLNGYNLYSASIDKLDIDTEYFIRGYAVNEAGIAYSDEVGFTTKDGIPKLTIDYLQPLAISERVLGELTNDGGLDVLELGVCYNNIGNPTIADSSKVISLDNNTFDYTITNLKPNTTYYIKSYIVNELGIHYGNEVVFTTLDSLAEISTYSVTGITATSAVGGGYIIATNGVDVIEKGVCFNTSGVPTINDLKVISSSALNTNYEVELNGLQRCTDYYIRAYIINEFGVSYGEEKQFTTSDGRPVVNTIALSEVTYTSVKTGGEIITDEGEEITEKGLCWNNSGNPTVGDFKQISGNGTDDYSIRIENLTEGETYFFKAYAINANGIGYGSEVTVTLTDDNISIQDYDGNWYNVVRIGNQVWMKENLKTTHYSDGTKIDDGSEITDITGDDKYWMIPTYSDGNEAYKNLYGLLYTWAAAVNGSSGSSSNPSNIQGVCPDGWHMPSDAEWLVLANYLGGINIAGGKMKEVGLKNWNAPNVGATNESNFTALPAGHIHAGSYLPTGTGALFWTTNNVRESDGYIRECVTYYTELNSSDFPKKAAVSVRCVKD